MDRVRLALACMGTGALLGASGCADPECIVGPPPLTAEVVASCVAPPPGSIPEPQIVSASAHTRADGSMVLTWSSFRLRCETSADDVQPLGDCPVDGWVASATVDPGSISDGPGMVQVTALVRQLDNTAGVPTVRLGNLTGAIELIDVGEDCVTGVIHQLRSDDPTAPDDFELDGSFLAPRC